MTLPVYKKYRPLIGAMFILVAVFMLESWTGMSAGALFIPVLLVTIALITLIDRVYLVARDQ